MSGSILRGRAEVARRAHNPEVAGSIPAPATKQMFCAPIREDSVHLKINGERVILRTHLRVIGVKLKTHHPSWR